MAVKAIKHASAGGGSLKTFTVTISTETENSRSVGCFVSLPWVMHVKSVRKISGSPYFTSCEVYFSNGARQNIDLTTVTTLDKDVMGFYENPDRPQDATLELSL